MKTFASVETQKSKDFTNIKTQERAKPSEIKAILTGAEIQGVWSDGSDDKDAYPFETQIRVRQPDGSISFVEFGSDEGGETDMTDEERDWNHFYMKVKDQDADIKDLSDFSILELQELRESLYKRQARWMADAMFALENELALFNGVKTPMFDYLGFYAQLCKLAGFWCHTEIHNRTTVGDPIEFKYKSLEKILLYIVLAERRCIRDAE